MGFEFTLVDVFSDRPFGGNQLAVFPDAGGIADETMQRLAREFNFSETTFVLPPRDPSHTCQVRIFTPHQELPFAGHPTVGTAAVLARRGEGDAAEQQFVFEEGIGPVTVAIDGQTIRLHLHPPDYETPDDAPPAAAIAKALTLPEDAIVETWYAGVGLRFCFVRLADQGLVDRAVWTRPHGQQRSPMAGRRTCTSSPVTIKTVHGCTHGSSHPRSASMRIPPPGRHAPHWSQASPSGHRIRTALTTSKSTREWPWAAPACWKAPPTRRTGGSSRSSSAGTPPSSAMAP
jgi:PhzF family phenazine biosynthesis protein